MAIKRRPVPPPNNEATRHAAYLGYAAAVQTYDTIDCKPADLQKWMKQAIDNDASSFFVRISQYGPSLEPANFQAIVQFSNANRPWAVVIHEDAYQAFAQALKKAAGMPGPTMKQRSEAHASSKDAAGILQGSAVGGVEQSSRRFRKRPRKAV